eukprot:scaffold330547_cov20-Prasinocladus_malaysianus.AAC.1
MREVSDRVAHQHQATNVVGYIQPQPHDLSYVYMLHFSANPQASSIGRHEKLTPSTVCKATKKDCRLP